MIIKYEFLNGDVSEIEVDDSLGEVIVSIDHAVTLNNRRETRRHESYSDDNDKLDCLIDPNADTQRFVLQLMDLEALRKALSQLNPNERYIINRLYLDDETISQAELARELGITEGSVKKSAYRIRLKLRYTIT